MAVSASRRLRALKTRQKRSLFEALLLRRNRILANPSFGRWASAFPLTRFIARRRARALFDICSGFVYTQVLLACVRLKVFEAVADEFKTVGQIAEETGLTGDAAARLTRAAVSLRLLERRGDEFTLGPLGAATLANPSLPPLIEHHALLYNDLRDPVALLRGAQSTDELAPYWPYAKSEDPLQLGEETVSAYTRLMSSSQDMVASELLGATRLTQARLWLDVGGGDGTFVSKAAARQPDTNFVLFDLPAVAALARRRFQEASLEDRTTVAEGNFFKDPMPTGADVVSLIRIVHDHNDDDVLTLLKNIRAAVEPGTTLLVAEPMSDTPGAEPIGDAYFGFYLLAMGRGKPRTPAEIKSLLAASGFGDPKLLHTHLPLIARIIKARAV